jgi:hypothetical protein
MVDVGRKREEKEVERGGGHAGDIASLDITLDADETSFHVMGEYLEHAFIQYSERHGLFHWIKQGN